MMRVLFAEEDKMIVFRNDDGSELSLPLSLWQELFGSAQTYNELIASPNCSDGWKQVFDRLREQGLLS